MFFLLRATFWISLVLVLLPSDGSEPPQASQIGATDAFTAAAAAISDATRFCERQPETCTLGSHAASTYSQRAQAGAKRLYGMVTDKNDKTDKGDAAPAASAKPRPTISSQNTLLATDREIPFRAPSAKSENRPRNAS